jgi:hypothetical protein
VSGACARGARGVQAARGRSDTQTAVTRLLLLHAGRSHARRRARRRRAHHRRRCATVRGRGTWRREAAGRTTCHACGARATSSARAVVRRARARAARVTPESEGFAACARAAQRLAPAAPRCPDAAAPHGVARRDRATHRVRPAASCLAEARQAARPGTTHAVRRPSAERRPAESLAAARPAAGRPAAAGSTARTCARGGASCAPHDKHTRQQRAFSNTRHSTPTNAGAQSARAARQPALPRARLHTRAAPRPRRSRDPPSAQRQGRSGAPRGRQRGARRDTSAAH